MAYRELKPLHSKRDSPDEVAFVRAQAEFYYDILKDDFRYLLQPACFNCASDDLYHHHYDAALICNECGLKNTALRLRAGRISER